MKSLFIRPKIEQKWKWISTETETYLEMLMQIRKMNWN